MRLTETEYQILLMRNPKAQLLPPKPGTAARRESDLHDDIKNECNRRGWIALHGSMAHRAHRTIGEPDFVILADGGRLILIEAKAAGGKLSSEQAALHAWASKLGHTVHVVRSLEEFLAVAVTFAETRKNTITQ